MVALSLVAATLCLLFVGRHSLWLDEAVSLRAALVPWDGLAHELAREANMPAYYLLLRAWSALGTGEAILRSLSVVFAVATVPVLYALVARLFDVRVAAIASLLLSVNAFFVHYAQEVRGYSLLLLASVCATYFFVRGVRQSSWRVWAAYAAAIAVAFHTHNFGLWIPVVHGASLLFLTGRRVPRRDYLGACAVAAVISVPFARVVVDASDQDKLAWVARPAVGDVVEAYERLAGDNFGSPLLKWSYLVACVLGLLAAARVLRSAGRWEKFWPHGLLLTWVTVPVVGSYVFSVMVTPVFVPRYLIVSLPALVVLAALGLAQLPPRLLAAAGLVVVGTSLTAVTRWYGSDGQENWRSATAHVVSRLGSNDLVVVTPAYLRLPLGYYSDRLGLPSELISSEVGVLDAGRRDTVWVMQGRLVPPRRFSCLLNRTHVKVGEQRFTGVLVKEFRPRQTPAPGSAPAPRGPVC